ncbi:hypothetical protein GGX14DRAFT_397369 [Mycena pura]|uniref:Uncharacterized protein n=1 Tax=Mycena pura TaxID=153505 RepID=A0AAD6YCS9_9AGAR|nr:hypothetical protein GGX14DRAFT_397369 [Mycena pura]
MPLCFSSPWFCVSVAGLYRDIFGWVVPVPVPEVAVVVDDLHRVQVAKRGSHSGPGSGVDRRRLWRLPRLGLGAGTQPLVHAARYSILEGTLPPDDYYANHRRPWRPPFRGLGADGRDIADRVKKNQSKERSPSPSDPGRDTKNQVVEQSQQATQAKSVSKHEWLQSPSPQDSKIAKGRWGAVNELNSHTVWQRCIQYSKHQYMVEPEFLTQDTPKDSGSASSEPQRENIPKEVKWITEESKSRQWLQSVKMSNVMKGVELNDRMEVGEMTQGMMGNGGKRAARIMWEKWWGNAELHEVSWCLEDADEEERAEDIEEEDSDPVHRVVREVKGHLQETQRNKGIRGIGWIGNEQGSRR